MTIAGALAGHDASGRSVRHSWADGAGNEIAGWLSTWNGPAGVGTNRRASEERTHLFDGSGTQPPHLDSYVLDSAFRQVAFTRNSSVTSLRALDGANKMTSFLDEGLSRSPAVDQHPDPAERGMNQYSSMDGLAWAFTDNGALATDSILSHEFDVQGRLVRSTEELTGTMVLENVHAPDGRRVLTRRGGQTLRFLHDGWQVLEERSVDEASGTATLLRQHVTGRWMDDHVQLLDAASGEVYYHHANDQGFTGALTDSSGWPVEFYEYSWLGRPSVLNPVVPGGVTDRSSVGNPYLFQGRRWEPEVQLYDFRHRWYSPGSEEFLSLDPTGTWRHGMGNGYEAFGGDPWNRRDPAGLADYQATFDGSTFTLHGPDGSNIWSAASGREVDFEGGRPVSNASQQDVADYGPLPEGSCSFSVEDIQLWDELSLLQKLFAYVPGKKVGAWSGGYHAWGSARVDLVPDDATAAYIRALGRDVVGFMLHGGTSWGSAGCIDLHANADGFRGNWQPQESVFGKLLGSAYEEGDIIRLTVDYPSVGNSDSAASERPSEDSR